MKKLTVYVADDHTLFRKALVQLISGFDAVAEVFDVENGKELVTLVKRSPPDLAIVDMQMPIMDGVEACEYLIPRYPDLKVIILTMHDSDQHILHMIEMGVHAFLLKNTNPEELEKAIGLVIKNDFYHNDLVVNALRKNLKDKLGAVRPKFNPASLTEREREIIVVLCRELSNKEIGAKLALSERTIENHRFRMMEKLKLKSTVGLVRFAFENGFIE